MWRTCLLLLLLAGVAVFRSGAVRNDRWQVIGPGGGGAQFVPAISPHDPNIALVACDMTGTYLTLDGGKNWRLINLHGVSRFFAFDPSDAKTIYAGTGALWRSSDTGKTWALVYPDPKTVTGVEMPDDHASERFRTDPPAARVLALAADRSKRLYAAFSDSNGSSLRRSGDGGRTWVNIGTLPAGAKQIHIDFNSPEQNRTVYVGGAAGVVVLRDGEWHSQAAPPEPLTDLSIGQDEKGIVVYGVGTSGAYLSRNGGESWKRAVTPARLRAIATSRDHPNAAYLSYGELMEDGVRYHGVAKTTDYGETWRPLWKEGRTRSPNVDDGWISERFGPGWGERPLHLAAAPTNPELCFATDMGRTLKTTDGGETWRAVYTKRTDTGWTTTGLDVTTTYGVHFDPFDSKRIFISYTDIGLFASSDGGTSWESATLAGVPREWVNTTYWMEFDPAVGGRVWAVMSGTHDLPRPKMWRQASPSRYRGGVVQSDDGGRTWRTLTNGLPQTAATHILLDRRSKAESRVLYAAGFGKGVFRSDDGGASWQLKNSGLPEGEPFVWRLAQDGGGVLYVVIARRSEDGSIGGPGDGALYRSKDRAESWEPVRLPAGVNGPNGLAIDPDDPKRLYLAAWRRRSADAEAGGGVFLSTDGGASWRQVLSQDQHVYDVTIDPGNKSTLYACGFESSAWRSTDRGQTWQRIRGYNFKWGHRVIPDPRDASMVYITTFGGSVWHGPAAGDPRAVEDTLPIRQ